MKSKGSWIRVKNSNFFPGKFPKTFDFSRQISENFRFFQANFRKILNFLGKNFRMTFFSNLLKNFRLSKQNCHLQLNSVQLFPFPLKSNYFRTYMYIQDIIMFHDPSTTPPSCGPHNPQPKIWEVVIPQNLGLTPM